MVYQHHTARFNDFKKISELLDVSVSEIINFD